MAGDWIKMRANLQTHPKIVRMMSALNADRLRVVGGLHAVWCLFDEHSEDGHLDGYTTEALDKMIGWDGFSAALVGIAWLETGDGFLALPRFGEHNGKSAKRRATEAQRKREERAQDDAQNVHDLSASHADKKRTREEKRREGKEDPRKRVVITRPDDVGEQIWADWRELRRTKKAPITETVMSGARGEAAKAGMTLEQFLVVWCRRGSQGLEAGWLKPHELPGRPPDVKRRDIFAGLEQQ